MCFSWFMTQTHLKHLALKISRENSTGMVLPVQQSHWLRFLTCSCHKVMIRANIMPVFKMRSKQSLNNYRPINLTSLVVMMMEHLVHREVSGFLCEHCKLCTIQHEFHNTHSCQIYPMESSHQWANAYIFSGVLDFQYGPTQKIVCKARPYWYSWWLIGLDRIIHVQLDAKRSCGWPIIWMVIVSFGVPGIRIGTHIVSCVCQWREWLHLKPPKFEHIFVAVITFSHFLLCRYFWYQLVSYFVCFKMIGEMSLLAHFLRRCIQRQGSLKKIHLSNCCNDNSLVSCLQIPSLFLWLAKTLSCDLTV